MGLGRSGVLRVISRTHAFFWALLRLERVVNRNIRLPVMLESMTHRCLGSLLPQRTDDAAESCQENAQHLSSLCSFDAISGRHLSYLPAFCDLRACSYGLFQFHLRQLWFSYYIPQSYFKQRS